MKTIFSIIIICLGSLTLNANAQKMSFGTNGIGYLALGTINGEFSVGLTRNWSILLSGAYNPFTYNKESERQFQHKEATVALGTRYWPWHLFSGWFMGSRVLASQYNRGGLLTPTSEEGELIGIGLNGGYSLMIAKNINIEFGAGVLFGGRQYTSYECPRCGRIISQSKKFFISPDNLLLQFVILF